jgi:hypothetical protein
VNCSVGVNLDALGEVHVGRYDFALHAENGSRKNVEGTDSVPFGVEYGEGVASRENDVSDFTLEKPSHGHCIDCALFFGGLAGSGFLGAVPGDSERSRDSQGLNDGKSHFYLDILFLSLIKLFLISHTENPN